VRKGNLPAQKEKGKEGTHCPGKGKKNDWSATCCQEKGGEGGGRDVSLEGKRELSA